ncbi:Transcription factor TRY [Glycine soja]|nr:Transcription factor TRY [Glycine soja]
MHGCVANSGGEITGYFASGNDYTHAMSSSTRQSNQRFHHPPRVSTSAILSCMLVNNWSNVESTTETTSRQQSLHPSLLVCIISGSSEGKDRSMSTTATTTSEEVSSNEWKVIHMSEQEEDLIRRMYKLVGDKWNLIAGRIPGRKAEEIERFWIMRHGDAFSVKRNGSKTQDS